MTTRVLTGLLLSSFLAAATPGHAAPDDGWRTAWSSAPDSAGPALPAQTLRQVVRSATSGSRVRVRLSNLFGTTPLTLGAAHVGLSAGGARVQPGSDRALTFDGRPAVTIAPGASAVSDPVDLAVGARTALAVSLYLPSSVPVSTIHGAALQTAYVNAPGDATAAADFPSAATDDNRYFLADVDVLGAGEARTLAIVGDSIADGIGSGDDHDAPGVVAGPSLYYSQKIDDRWTAGVGVYVPFGTRQRRRARAPGRGAGRQPGRTGDGRRRPCGRGHVEDPHAVDWGGVQLPLPMQTPAWARGAHPTRLIGA
jgi:hypothetical protein